MLQAGIALLKGNKAHTGVYGVLLSALIWSANLLIEHGELKAAVKYQEMALTELTERCFED